MLVTSATATPGIGGAASPPPEAVPYSERNCLPDTVSQVANCRPEAKT